MGHPRALRRVRVAAAALTTGALGVLAAGCGGHGNQPVVAYPLGKCAPKGMQGPYWPSRLHDRDASPKHDDCITIKGKVIQTKWELDGDMHIKVLLDKPYRKYLTRGNEYQKAGGKHDLFVLEIIPQHCHGIYPYDTNCADNGGFRDPAYPRAGDYIEATGWGVRDFDKAHRILGYPPQADGWAEIHPVTALRVLKPAPPNYPNPPSNSSSEPDLG